MHPTQKEKAQRFMSLHSQGRLLVLPNVWDVIGARILERKGCAAVATSSSAIAASLGYDDGEKIGKATAIGVIEQIARSVAIPVTADIETGYGATTAELVETAELVVGAGAAGINIEDSLQAGGPLRSVEEQCSRISTIREVASRRGVPLVINARIDSYFSPSFASREEATEEAIVRAQAYIKAGADCIYPMGPGDEATVRILRSGINAPLNILITPTAVPLAVLQDLGVNRASLGPFVFRSCLRKFSEIADQLLAHGDYSCFSDMMTRAEVAEFVVAGQE